MVHFLRITYGNDLNHLADILAGELFSSGARPFEKRLIVIPHIVLKSFLVYRFLSNPHLKVAAGVQILPLNQAVEEVFNSLGLGERKKIPSFLELTLAIEGKLRSSFAENFPELREYLNLVDSKQSSLRIMSLSDELARVFARYGLYGQEFLPRWLSLEGWQQALWQEIFSPLSSWSYPLEVLHTNLPRFEGKIVLFGFSYLSSAHLNFFSSIGVAICQVSPCAYFWQDHASEKEQLFIRRSLRKSGVQEKVEEEINKYMQNNHPLLGNWGKLGREMLKSLDRFTLLENDAYQAPEGESLLCALKHSLLHLDETSPLKADDSIQVHSATSRLREVEVLRDVLETLMQKHCSIGSPIMPSDILVVSPEISSYAPYIQMVFAESSFAFSVEGMPLSSVSEAVQGFLQLLRLPHENYSLTSFNQLLRCASFRQKSGFTAEQVYQLSKWFKQAQIRRGLSQGANSWEEGLERLLYGLVLIPNEESRFPVCAVSSIPQSEIDLFDRFLKLFSEIKNDLAKLSEEKVPSAWFKWLLELSDKYFALEWEREPFFIEVRSLSLTCTKVKCGFESIERVLRYLAQKPGGDISSAELQKISFRSLSPGSLTSAKIIWCLGMDEGAFPRTDAQSSLCQMARFKTGDYVPTKVDEDRNLFLEMFLKAKDYLIFSYQRIHAEDGKYQELSLLIDELNQYLNKHSGISLAHLDHPAFPFDQSYFSPEAKVKKWSQVDFAAAKAHYFPQSSRPAFFVSTLQDSSPNQEISIDIRQLKKLARHPLQFYFNETLKVYLKEEEDEEEAEFLISYMRKALLRKKSLRSNASQVLHRAKVEGNLPQGIFQEIAIQELEEETADLFQELAAFQVEPAEIQSMRLSSPLVIPLSESRVARITGTLEDVSPKGLLYHGEKDLKSLVKVWPLYLIYRCLYGNGPLLLTKKGISLEVPIVDPHKDLAAYLEYYLRAKQTPSPLMPEWAPALLQGTADDLKKILTRETEDPYVSYLKRRQGLFNPLETFDQWNRYLRQLLNCFL